MAAKRASSEKWYSTARIADDKLLASLEDRFTLWFARLRRPTTLCEAALRRDLRGRRAESKFRCQVPIGPFVVYFACLEARVVVEVDRPSHGTPEGRARDAVRDARLKREGWHVVRVTNDEVKSGLALGIVEAGIGGAGG